MTDRGIEASARVPSEVIGTVATTTPLETISSFSTATIERRLTRAVSRCGPTGSASSSPTSRPSRVKDRSGPFEAKVFPALIAASHAR